MCLIARSKQIRYRHPMCFITRAEADQMQASGDCLRIDRTREPDVFDWQSADRMTDIRSV